MNFKLLLFFKIQMTKGTRQQELNSREIFLEGKLFMLRARVTGASWVCSTLTKLCMKAYRRSDL